MCSVYHLVTLRRYTLIDVNHPKLMNITHTYTQTNIQVNTAVVLQSKNSVQRRMQTYTPYTHNTFLTEHSISAFISYFHLAAVCLPYLIACGHAHFVSLRSRKRFMLVK